MEKKITKKEVFNAVINMVNENEIKMVGDVPAEAVVETLTKAIEQLDKKAAKAKERAAAKAAEGDILTALVRAALTTDEFKSIADVTAMVAEEEPDVTAAKVSYRLSSLVKAGEAEKSEITIPATETSKKRTVNGYRRING